MSKLSIHLICQAFCLSILAVLSLGCGLPPAPAPPPPMCCPCAPPAPPPPTCCPCPPPPPPPPSCGGGCLAARRHRMFSSASLRKYWRNKREATNETIEGIGEESPQIINDGSVPCPKAEWAPFIRQAIIPDDPYASVHSIQSVLLREITDQKFLVTCAKSKDVGEGENVLPDGIKFSSNGQSFCNVRQQERTLWCSAMALIE